jgi:hypothetical protein
LIGSAMYFPAISAFTAGGILFTIGSATFLIADVLEWLTNNHVGCIWDSNYRESFEKSSTSHMAPAKTFSGWYQRAENGINFFFSACGSFLYLVGSIMYIPSTNMLTDGIYTFIIGSAVIFFSQSWKLYRQGLALNARNVMEYSTENYSHDMPAFYIDLGAGAGGFLYCVGSILALPSIDTTIAVTTWSAVFFQLGGISFFLSGAAMYYRYFYTENYYH